MSERVVVYQDKSFRTEFRATDPNDKDTQDLEAVMHLHNLTPYGMLLASVGSCTAIVVNTYARNHGIPLKSITVDASYDRVFAEDCDNCDEDTVYEEIIKEKLNFEGDLSESEMERLHKVAKACSIRRMLESGIRIKAE
jgi:uncharacterized OsmC-like protein